MKKITTLFCALAILVLFILISGCSHSKKESETGEIADNDAVNADIDDGDDADSEDTEPDDDSDADIDNKELPECSPTSETPCKDSSSGLIWSSKSNGVMYWHDAAYYCSDLSEGGYSDWHLPSIDELRTLIENCWKTETGGTCRASKECCESHCEDDVCSGCSFNSTGYYSKFDDSDILWSDSWPYDWTDCSWIVDFSGASVQIDSSYEYYGTRCVRDDSEESREDDEVAGSDSAKGCFKVDGRVWSNRVKMFWSEAVDYCNNLNECGISDWHLPTISELRTLIRNSFLTESGGECGVTDDCLSRDNCYDFDSCNSINNESYGWYSKLGDREWFWSSSALSDRAGPVWGVNFRSASVLSFDNDIYDSAGSNVRCVSKGKDKDPDGCASSEYQCLHSQSLRCEDGYWIPDKYCENGCDSSTGKCR